MNDIYIVSIMNESKSDTALIPVAICDNLGSIYEIAENLSEVKKIAAIRIDINQIFLMDDSFLQDTTIIEKTIIHDDVEVNFLDFREEIEYNEGHDD